MARGRRRLAATAAEETQRGVRMQRRSPRKLSIRVRAGNSVVQPLGKQSNTLRKLKIDA